MSNVHASTYYYKMPDDEYYLALAKRPLRTGTTSKFRGVSFDRPSGKWRAGLTHKGRRYYLGYFATEVDAAKAYNEKAISIIGPNAVLNEFPSND